MNEEMLMRQCWKTLVSLGRGEPEELLCFKALLILLCSTPNLIGFGGGDNVTLQARWWARPDYSSLNLEWTSILEDQIAS